MNARELDELLDAYFLGDPTDAEQVRLKESLRGDAASRRRFVEAALLEARLHAARASMSSDVSTAAVPDPARNLPPEPRGIARRLPIRLRQLDLAAIAVVAAVVIAGYYFIRPTGAPSDDVAIEGVPTEQWPIGQKPIEQDRIDPRERNVTPADDGSVAEPDGKSRRLDGYIKAVDGEAKTFVVAGPKEAAATFQVAVAAAPPREPTHILLDGDRSTFDEAIRSNRRATVIFLPANDGPLWVWKVEVSSQAR